MKVSLVISTYNRPDALRVCLDSVLKQKVMPDEVIIGDDGSGESTAEVIRHMRSVCPVPVLHVWHEDKGFRKAMMMNKAIASASGDYIIEMDGDVYLHPLYVSDHVKAACRGFYLKGGRTNLGKRLTDKICAEGRAVPIHFWTKGIEEKPENTIHCSWISRLIAPYYRRNRSFGLGCNLSFFKDDFIRINGYDEFYEGWGAEDTDLVTRLLRLGIRKKSLKFAGIVYHLWHEDKFMYNVEKNYKYLDECNVKGTPYCKDGVDKYLTNPEKFPITVL